jgi:hypothetical protein
MQKIICISPFEDETEVITIDGLTIENRLDMMSIYGTLDIPKDKEGLERILDLKRQVDTIAAYLKREDLPNKIVIENKAKDVTNPFEEK